MSLFNPLKKKLAALRVKKPLVEAYEPQIKWEVCFVNDNVKMIKVRGPKND